MKRTYLAKRNALLSSRSVSWGTGALLFSLVMLFVRLFAPNFFWQVWSPVFRAGDVVAAESHAVFSSFGNASQLAAQNEKLASENVALANKNQTLEQKIASLLLLATAPSIAISGIVAGVVARPPQSPYDTLVLAAGKKTGVQIGMEAFGEGGSPIGIVSSISSDFSRVTLFSSPGIATGAWVGHASLPLTVIGAGAGVLTASVARSAGIVAGDVVFVPGPGMLPIGSVERVEGDPLSPVMTLRIVPSTNPFSIAWVALRATGIVPPSFATSTVP